MRIHQPAEDIKDPDIALEMLKDGNERYLRGETILAHDHAHDREILEDAQKPFAVILTCSDSRVSPEVFFDQDLGDIFVIRNAGNIADQTALGSIEYAVEHLHSPLVVVVGHSKCGAVTAAYEGGELPANIAHIADYIKPVCSCSPTLDEAVHAHIDSMVEQIKSDTIVQHLGAKVVGAYYDLHTGKVIWQ